MINEKLMAASTAIADQVNKMHVDRRTWSAPCGQWLVYGFETTIGFANSIELCGRVERAYKNKQCIKTTIYEFLMELKGSS